MFEFPIPDIRTNWNSQFFRLITQHQNFINNNWGWTATTHLDSRLLLRRRKKKATNRKYHRTWYYWKPHIWRFCCHENEWENRGTNTDCWFVCPLFTEQWLCVQREWQKSLQPLCFFIQDIYFKETFANQRGVDDKKIFLLLIIIINQQQVVWRQGHQKENNFRWIIFCFNTW